jgi:1-phosphofructokinase family hexose kinase
MLVVTPNLCFDRVVSLTRLERGAVLRASRAEQSAGGKGVNVLRVLAAFGRPATLIGAFAAAEAPRMRTLLEQEGHDVVLVPVEAPAGRTALILHEPGGVDTVVNEPGELSRPAQWRDVVAAVLARIGGHEALICSGSLPSGAPVDGYAELVRAGRRAELLTVVDTAPPSLRAALPAEPDLVTPNLGEAEAALSGRAGDVLTDHGGDARERALAAGRGLVAAGARRAAVTVGAAGVAFVGRHSIRWVPAVPVQTVSAVGAGDSFLAGLLLAGLGAGTDDETWGEAVVQAVAVAAASCETPRPGAVDPARVAALLAAGPPTGPPSAHP